MLRPASASSLRLSTAPNPAYGTPSKFYTVPTVAAPNAKPPIVHRRSIEVRRGMPMYDGAAGRASSHLVHSRNLAASSSEPDLAVGTHFFRFQTGIATRERPR